MTPKEKAQELFQLFYFPHYKFNNETGTSVIDEKLTKIVQKRFALIAVDELINEVYNISHQYTAVYDITTMTFNYEESKELKFWQDVKQEIEQL